MLEYQQALRMAQLMKKKNKVIRHQIMRCQKRKHGVVALRFSDECRKMKIEVLDEPFEPDVRVYPG